MFDPLKCHILSFKTVVGKLCKFHVIKVVVVVVVEYLYSASRSASNALK